jgi:hypothetical protein
MSVVGPKQDAVELGALIARATGEAGAELSVYEDGFAAHRGGDLVMSGRWAELLWFKRGLTRLNIYGVTRDYARLELATARGTFVLDGRGGEADAAHLAQLAFAERATPVLLERARADLAAQGYAEFGGLRITRAGVGYRKGGVWREAKVAGWKITQGTLLIDENDDKPKLVVQIGLTKLPSSDVVLTLLEEVAPGKNLAAHPYKVSGSAWRPSAATHDPRYVATRTRLIGLVVVPGAILGLVIVGAIILRIASLAEMAGHQRQQNTFSDDAAKKLATFANAPVPSTSLSACEGKAGDIDQVVFAFIGDADSGLKPNPAYARTAGAAGWNSILEERVPYLFVQHPHLLMVRLLPGSHVSNKERSVVRAHARVLDEKGATLCEGVAEGWYTPGSMNMTTMTVGDGLSKLVMGPLCGARRDYVCSGLKGDYVTRFSAGPYVEPAPPPLPKKKHR